MDSVVYRGTPDDQECRQNLLETDELISGEERCDNEDVEFEESIARTGYGCFHYQVLLLCGWAVSSDAIEVLSISFILPPAGCDLNLSSFDKGALNSVIFIGMMIGGYVWGSLSDLYGRRAMLVWSLALNALGGLASSLAQSYPLFMVLRLVSGIGVGGSQPMIFSYFVEFQPKARRGAMISFLASFWVSGNIIAAALAWAVIPRVDLNFQTATFTYDSWRVYVALCTIPALTSALMFLCMPESPKYLLQVNRAPEALNVLRRVFAINSGRDQAHYPVQSLSCPKSREPITDQNSRHVSGSGRVSNCCRNVVYTVKGLARKTARLFGRHLLRTTLITIYVFTTLSFGYYGLFMWLPELFSRMAKFGGSACDTTYANSSIVPTPAPSNGSCVVDNSSKIYLEGFITALSTMPGNVLAIIIMDRVGSRLLLALGMIGSAVSVFFLWFVSTELQGFILSCIFSGVSNIGWVALDVVSCEVFPTEVRATSMGLSQVSARTSGILGNLAFGALVTTNCAVPMLMVVFFLATGGLAALLLPNKRMMDIE